MVGPVRTRIVVFNLSDIDKKHADTLVRPHSRPGCISPGLPRSGARPVGAPALGACPHTSGFGLVQGHGTFPGFTMGPPNRSMGLKPPPPCAPLGELPLHHEAEGVAFFLFPISPSFANAVPSKPPPSRCCFFCSRLNRGAPAGLPGPCQTPPRYGVTSFSSPVQVGRAWWYPGANMCGGGPCAIPVRPVSVPCLHLC